MSSQFNAPSNKRASTDKPVLMDIFEKDCFPQLLESCLQFSHERMKAGASKKSKVCTDCYQVWGIVTFLPALFALMSVSKAAHNATMRVIRYVVLSSYTTTAVSMLQEDQFREGLHSFARMFGTFSNHVHLLHSMVKTTFPDFSASRLTDTIAAIMFANIKDLSLKIFGRNSYFSQQLFLSLNNYFPKLQRLDVSHLCSSHVPSFALILQSCPLLDDVRLGRCIDKNTFPIVMASFAAFNNRISTMDLTSCIANYQLTQIPYYVPNLKFLICNCVEREPKRVILMLKTFHRLSSHGGLDSLSMHRSNFTDKSMDVICAQFPRISLYVDHDELLFLPVLEDAQDLARAPRHPDEPYDSDTEEYLPDYYEESEEEDDHYLGNAESEEDDDHDLLDAVLPAVIILSE